MTEVICDECKIGRLQARQFNSEEVIFLCNNSTCTWPLYPHVGQDLAHFIVKRKISDLDLEVTLPIPKKKQKLNKPVEYENQPIVLDEDSLDQLLNDVNTISQQLDLSEIFGDSIVCPDKNLDPNDTNNNLDLSDTLLDFSSLKEDFGFAIPDAVASETPAIGPAPCVSLLARDAEPEGPAASVALASPSNEAQPRSRDACRIRSNLAPEHLGTKVPNSRKKAKKARHAKAKIAAANGGSENVNGTNSTRVQNNEAEVCDIPFDERGCIDACLCLLVHSQHVLKLKGGPTTFIRKLVSYYKNRIVEVNSPRNKNAVTWTTIKRGCSDILIKRLTSTWTTGQRLPACALSELVKMPMTVNKLFKCDVRSEISCTICGKKIVSIDAKTIHIMEKVPENFTVTKACCFTQCSSCGADNQKKLVTYYILPDILAIQFSSGLPERSITSFDFVHQGNLYKVTMVVQHHAESDRFFAWTWNHKDNSWVRHNSINDQPVKHGTLGVPPAECHLLIWEKCDPSKQQEKSHPTQASSNHSRTQITSQRTPSSQAMLSPLASLPSPVMPTKARLKTAPEKRVSIPGVRTYSASASGKTNVFGSRISRHSDELDELLPSPANSETSNASDGDVTIANSSFFVPLRNNRNTTEKPLEGYRWLAENLTANQQKWVEFKCQPQKKIKAKRKTPEKRLPTHGKRLPVRKDPTQAQKLLAGLEIFLN